jgi:hypothetical protein
VVVVAKSSKKRTNKVVGVKKVSADRAQTGRRNLDVLDAIKYR